MAINTRQKKSKNQVFAQFSAKFAIDNPIELLPELIDQLVAHGEMARRLSHTIGGNGHRPEKTTELIRKLLANRGLVL